MFTDEKVKVVTKEIVNNEHENPFLPYIIGTIPKPIPTKANRILYLRIKYYITRKSKTGQA